MAEFLKGEALSIKNKKERTEKVYNLNAFKDCLAHYKNDIFGDCTYQINKARQERLRLPARQPPEEKMMQIRTYILQKKWMQYSTRISG